MSAAVAWWKKAPVMPVQVYIICTMNNAWNSFLVSFLFLSSSSVYIFHIIKCLCCLRPAQTVFIYFESQLLACVSVYVQKYPQYTLIDSFSCTAFTELIFDFGRKRHAEMLSFIFVVVATKQSVEV